MHLASLAKEQHGVVAQQHAGRKIIQNLIHDGNGKWHSRSRTSIEPSLAVQPSGHEALESR